MSHVVYWERNFKMVYYFTSNVVEPSAPIYVGKDKFESERDQDFFRLLLDKATLD